MNKIKFLRFLRNSSEEISFSHLGKNVDVDANDSGFICIDTLIVQYLYLDISYIAEERLNQESEILNFSLKLTKKNSIIYDFLELN